MGIFSAAVALFGKGEPQGTRPESKAGHAVAGSGQKFTVLIIDDDPQFLDTMRSLLRGEGYKVVASSTGPKGLDTVRYAAGNIDAVLLDFNMPRFNGLETLQFLRKLSPNVKVLAVSGISFNELPPEFREGVERFISKPFGNADLLKALGEVLEGKPAAQAPTALPA